MKILYLDCRMGVAGDMLMAALLELLPEGERQGFIDKLNGLGIPGVHAAMHRTAKCGVMGTHVAVTVHGEDEEDFVFATDDLWNENDRVSVIVPKEKIKLSLKHAEDKKK